jgi:hypothetical protein
MRPNLWKRTLTGPIALLAWLAAVLIGMVGMVRYQTRPGEVARDVNVQTPAHWPTAVRMPRDARRPTLVMSLHPHCPCSRASVRELAMLMSRADGRVDARVLFVQPNGAPSDWLNTDLWNEANAIPRVTVTVDLDGADSRALGATTSGAIVLYDPSGALRFAGGITDGRGHEGDNAGLDAILALLRDQTPRTTSTPVFGCPLQGSNQLATCGPRREQ